MRNLFVQEKQQLKITIDSVVEYILKQRYARTLDPEQILNTVHNASKQGCLYVATDGTEIRGCVVWAEFPLQSYIFIRHIAADYPAILRSFVHLFHDKYPGWKIEGYRRGKHVFYNNTHKLLERLYGR